MYLKSRNHSGTTWISVRRIVSALLLLVTAPATAGDGLFEPPVRLEAAGDLIDTDIGHAAPFIHDIDGDGADDLLVGQFGEGKLRIYRNVGTNDDAKYTAHEWFKADHEYGTVPSG